MQVFKSFFKIAKKHIGSSLIYLIIFMIISIATTADASDNSKKNFTASSIDICIIDKDESTVSKSLTNFLRKAHHIIDSKTEDKNVLQDYLYQQKIDYVLFIEKGFEKKLLSGNTTDLLSYSQLFDSTSSYFAGQQIDEYISTVNLYITGGFSLDDALAKTSSALLTDSNVSIIDFENRRDNPSSDYIFYYFQFLPYILICMLIIGLAPILIVFRKKDIDNRINCSALTLKSKNLQITSACILYGFTLWLIFIILSGILGGFNILFTTEGIFCIINSFLFFLISMAITLLISTFSVSNNVLSMLSNVIGIGMSFLCGIFVPQWLLGESILSFAHFLPAYWYIRANNMLSGFSGERMSYVNYWKYMGIEVLFFVALFSVYLVASKRRKN